MANFLGKTNQICACNGESIHLIDFMVLVRDTLEKIKPHIIYYDPVSFTSKESRPQ